MLKKSLLGLVFCASFSSINAQVKPLLQIGVDFGGDDIAGAQFSNGDNETIEAGSGLVLEGGVSASMNEKLDYQFLVGYKFDNIEASNADIDLSRFMVTALGVFNTGKISIGAGPTYHFSPELDSSGLGGDFKADFESALGVVVQAGYNFNPQYTAGLKATFIEYEASETGQKFDADAVGLYLSLKF